MEGSIQVIDHIAVKLWKLLTKAMSERIPLSQTHGFCTKVYLKECHKLGLGELSECLSLLLSALELEAAMLNLLPLPVCLLL